MSERSVKGVNLEERSKEYNVNEYLDFIKENGKIIEGKPILINNLNLNPEYLNGNQTHSFGDSVSIHFQEISGPPNF